MLLHGERPLPRHNPPPWTLDAAAIARWLEPLARRPGRDRRRLRRDSPRGLDRLGGRQATRDAHARDRRPLGAMAPGNAPAPRVRLALRRRSGAARRSAAVQQDARRHARSPAPRPARARPAVAGTVALRRALGRRLPPCSPATRPRHRLRWTLREIERAGHPSARLARRLVASAWYRSKGTFTAASRRGDETRRFSFHAPEPDATADEVRVALAPRRRAPRDRDGPAATGRPTSCSPRDAPRSSSTRSSSHPLEAGAESPLSGLEQARLGRSGARSAGRRRRASTSSAATSATTRERVPRSVKLLDAGRLAGRLTDRAHAPARALQRPRPPRGPPTTPRCRAARTSSSSPGAATTDEIARRLGTGLWIEEIDGGSVELSSGRFRLRFPRARRVRRGRLADECGAGLLSGRDPRRPLSRSIRRSAASSSPTARSAGARAAGASSRSRVPRPISSSGGCACGRLPEKRRDG